MRYFRILLTLLWCFFMISYANAEIELPIVGASASHVYANQTANLAIDNNPSTAWSSGVYSSSKP